MYRTFLPCLIGACAALLAAGGPAQAQIKTVTFDSTNLATPNPRIMASDGMCYSAIKVNGLGANNSYFDANGTGPDDAAKLLDTGMAVGVGLTTLRGTSVRIFPLNLRGTDPGGRGDFTDPQVPDSWFPFTTNGPPPMTADERNFTLRFRGYINVPAPGSYTYALRGDDYARLRIAGKDVVISRDVTKALQFAYVDFLAAGMYPAELVYFQNGTACSLELSKTAGKPVLPDPPPLAIPQGFTLLGRDELFSAIAGRSRCQECGVVGANCSQGNFCRDGLCQPCITVERCGNACQPCTGKTKICLAPADDTGENAKCVECTADSDCPGSTCDTTTNTCKPPPCMTDNDCKNNPMGPVCERDAGVCMPECRTDTDCRTSPNGNTCNMDAGLCVPMCRTNMDCKDPTKPVCEADAGVCGQCVVDLDCPAGQMCNGGTCVNTCKAGEEALYKPGTSELDKKNGAKRICVRIAYRGSWGCSAAPSQGPGAPLGFGGALLALAGLALLGRRRRPAASRALRFFFPVAAVAALLTLTSDANAQTTRALNAQTFQPALGPNNIIQVDGSRTPGKSTFFINGLFEYALNPARLVDQNTNEVFDNLVPHMLTMHLMPGVGIGRRFSFGGDLPLVLFQGFSQVTPTVPKQPNSFGLGDLRFAAKVRILDNSYEGIGLALVGQLSAGLGVGEDPNLHSIGKGNIGIEPRVVLDYKTAGGLMVALNLGALLLTDSERQQAPGLLVGHQFRYGLGALVPLSPTVALFGEVMGSAGFKTAPDTGRVYAPVEALVGARLFNSAGFVMNMGVGTALRGDFGTPQVRALLSMGFLPSYSDPDIDRDGILNEADRCPRVPGPPENQGCPDKDTDGDGIIDRLDRCPLQPGPKENHGCPDGDRDKDGIIDRLDKCPDQPGPKENDGCPDTDTDKDGIVDRLDKCPTEPGIPELDGCPDKDTDGDTVVDRLDKCPLEPGPKENNGCPEPDTDKDGLIDKIDRCPLEPGPKENQGCPDKDTDGDGIVDRLDQCPTVPGVPPTGCPERKFIVVTQEKIELKQKVFFATDKSNILPASFDLLNEVVAVLKERPTMKLRIEGHTDSRGTLEHNMKLSEARAASVRNYLIQAGIAAERLTSEGFGPTRPIGDNKTDAGREKNRRTEFFIVEQ